VEADAENLMTLLLAILSGFLLALLAPMLTTRLRGAVGWVLALLPATLAVYFASLLPEAAAGTPLAVSYPWVSDLGISLSLRADGLNLLFASLVSGVGTLVVCYAGGYLKGHPYLGRFYAWLLTFMTAMLGVALADNLLLLFVFWELTSLSSYQATCCSVSSWATAPCSWRDAPCCRRHILTLTLVQVVRGPVLPDRVVALDPMATLAMGFTVLYAVATEQTLYLNQSSRD
jgi:hypothetical protein